MGDQDNRRITLNGQSVPVEQAAGRVSNSSRLEAGTDRNAIDLKIVLGLLLAAVAGLFWLEAALAGTALITPIDPTLVWIMRALGAGAGLIAGLAVTFTGGRRPECWQTALILLFAPVMGSFLFEAAAWRAMDWSEFGFSSQPFAGTEYPITGLSHGRKRRRDAVEIDPYHTGSIEIPIPSDQYRSLFNNRDRDELCILVPARQNAGGAVQIRTDGDYTWNEPPPAQIGPCSERAGKIPGPNPWAPG